MKPNSTPHRTCWRQGIFANYCLEEKSLRSQQFSYQIGRLCQSSPSLEVTFNIRMVIVDSTESIGSLYFGKAIDCSPTFSSNSFLRLPGVIQGNFIVRENLCTFVFLAKLEECCQCCSWWCDGTFWRSFLVWRTPSVRFRDEPGGAQRLHVGRVLEIPECATWLHSCWHTEQPVWWQLISSVQCSFSRPNTATLHLVYVHTYLNLFFWSSHNALRWRARWNTKYGLGSDCMELPRLYGTIPAYCQHRASCC